FLDEERRDELHDCHLIDVEGPGENADAENSRAVAGPAIGRGRGCGGEFGCRNGHERLPLAFARCVIRRNASSNIANEVLPRRACASARRRVKRQSWGPARDAPGRRGYFFRCGITSAAKSSILRRASSSERMPNWNIGRRMPSPVLSRISSILARTVLGLPMSA